VKRLSLDQRRVLAEFCANFAVAWLAAGVVGPYVAGKSLLEVSKPAIFSVIWAGVLLIVMLYLTRGEKNEFT